MKPALMMSLEGVWYHWHEGTWQSSQVLPPLTRPVRILTDFAGAVTGVMTVDSKPEYAAAMIEKQVRAEGLVDGEARVLIHRLIVANGSCRVLYTAVPVAEWSALFARLQGEAAVALVFPLEAALLAQTPRHGAVLCRAGRQFHYLAASEEKLLHVTTTAYSDDPDDLQVALTGLMDRIETRLPASEEMLPVLWCDLLAAESEAASRLVSHFSQRLGVKVEVAPVSQFQTAAGPRRTALEFLARHLPMRLAVNSWRERLAAALDCYRLPITAAVGLVALALFVTAAAWTTQTLQIQQRTEDLRQEARTIAGQLNGHDVPSAQILASYAPAMAFWDGLSRAVEGPDLHGLLLHVRQAADKRVRVMRVQMGTQGVFRVDGVPAHDSNPEAALAGFLSALHARGYQVEAVDPGAHGQVPGFFSYTLRPRPDSRGASQP